MNQVDDKTAQSLSANSAALLPYLPYLLQDLWELGSNPSDINELIKKHIPQKSKISVLDLACGKGAVSIRLAVTTQFCIKGIDIIPAFIAIANEKTKEFNVSDRCEYIWGDINSVVEQEKNYDVVILGAVGDVLGTPLDTLQKLKKVVKPQGSIVFVDVYRKEKPACELRSEKDIFSSYEEWLCVFKQADLVLIESRPTDENRMKSHN